MSDKHMMCTRSGKGYDPLTLKPEDVDLGDMLHCLSQKPRFGAHSEDAITILEHSFTVAHYASVLAYCETWDKEDARYAFCAGLVHDLCEFAIPDVPRPLKDAVRFDDMTVEELEIQVTEVILEKFRRVSEVAKAKNPELKEDLFNVSTLRRWLQSDCLKKADTLASKLEGGWYLPGGSSWCDWAPDWLTRAFVGVGDYVDEEFENLNDPVKAYMHLLNIVTRSYGRGLVSEPSLAHRVWEAGT